MDADLSAALAPEALAPPIARDLGLPPDAVTSVLRRLAAGDQPAFLARYRPEHVRGLALRDLERIQARATHAVAFEFRRQQLRLELLAAERLDEETTRLLDVAEHVVELDDLRTLLRKRKRGAGGKARARGLGALASQLWACGSTGRFAGDDEAASDADPLELAAQFPSRRPASRPARRGSAPKKAQADATQADASSEIETEGTSELESSSGTEDAGQAEVAASAATEGTSELESSSGVDAAQAEPSPEAGATSDQAQAPSDADATRTEASGPSAHADPGGTSVDDAQPTDATSAESPGSAAAPAQTSVEAASAGDEPTPSEAAASAGDEPTPSEAAASAQPASSPQDATPPEEPHVPLPDRDLADARSIVADEAFALPIVVRRLRDLVFDEGRMRATVVPGKKDRGGRYARLAERVEPVAKLVPPQILGLHRGDREGALQLHLEVEMERFDEVCGELLGIDASRPCGLQLRQAMRDAWQGASGRAVRQGARKILKQFAERRAIGEFCEAYRPLLLAPALGDRPVLAVDPGFAPGCRVAVLDAHGGIVARDTVFPLEPKLQAPQAKARLIELAREHAVAAIAVTNGNGGRDVERLCRELCRETEDIDAVVVSADADMAGMFAGSRAAKQELADGDASLRRAVAAGRRLQNPLREVAKLDARKLGLGQYQHEVDQEELRAALEQVLTSCINEVGVDPNSATADELARVAGFSQAVAAAVVSHREQHGAFRSRQALLDVPGVPGRAFEQGAGFLRIEQGDHALDRTTIHPERHAQVIEMARALGVTVGDLIGNTELVGKLDGKSQLDKPGASGEPLGPATLDAILQQLRKPGADPRPPFEPVEFEPTLASFEDLTVGMELPGVITHLANFGAFVDVGLPQEALVHVSELSHGFISSPFEAVHVGQRVRGRVIEITPERKRFSLSLRALAPRPERSDKPSGKRRRKSDGRDGGGSRKGGGGSRKGDRGPRKGGDRNSGRGGQGQKGGSDRVLGFKLDLSALADRLDKN